MNPLLFSLGVGVDSSAVLVGALAKHPHLAHLAKYSRFLIATSDLEVEMPETYEFRDGYLGPWLAERGQEIHVLTPQVKDRHGEMHSNLADYYLAQAALPSRMTRSCTERFKIKTIQSWAKDAGINGQADVVIGFDCNEERRANKMSDSALYRYLFPMIDLGIDRLMAAKILLDAGLPVPRRSACFCCSFSKSQDWWELSWRYPALYDQATAMEQNIEDQRGRTFYFRGNAPLSDGVTPRVFRMPAEAVRLYERAQHHLAHITPAWPSYALCLAAQEQYGDNWPAAVAALKLGPSRLDDPWQIYTRLQYCLELDPSQQAQWQTAGQTCGCSL